MDRQSPRRNDKTTEMQIYKSVVTGLSAASLSINSERKRTSTEEWKGKSLERGTVDIYILSLQMVANNA